jgi:RNA polymerase sigma-70 factor (ECF subfamily)
MARVSAGDSRAFRVLVARHADRALATAWRMSASRADAEDLVQEAFLRVWRSAASFQPEKAKFTTWLHRLTLNLGVDRWRRRRPTVELEAANDVADPSPDALAVAEQSEDSAAVAEALALLPERQRMAVTLCYYEGLSNAEAADALGVPVGALEALLVRARRKLRGLLEKRMGEEG